MNETLGMKLKEARVKKGMSQNDIAEKLNISRQSISRWETDKSYPDIENLIELTKYYEISLDEILSTDHKLKSQFDNKTKKNKKNTSTQSKNSSTSDEGILLLIVAIISSVLFPIGLIVIPLVIIRNKKKNSFYHVVYIICAFSLFLNVYDGFAHLTNIMDWGNTSVEKIK